MTVKEIRELLFAIDNQEMTVKEMRGILFEELNQRLGVTADLFNRADDKDETPDDDDGMGYYGDHEDSGRGWASYDERKAVHE